MNDSKDIKGIYFYSVKDVVADRIIRLSCRVRLVDDSEKSYKIKLLEVHARHPIGHVMWVRKDSVKLDATHAPVFSHESRLPYKD